EPGRSVEDGNGGLHVVLRGGGGIVDLDRSGHIVSRRAVCPAPRGIAWQAKSYQLLVACATGELVRMLPTGGAPIRTTWIRRDLRDVVVDTQAGSVYVSTLRTGTLLGLYSDDTVQAAYDHPLTDTVSQVAFRAIAHPVGHAMV